MRLPLWFRALFWQVSSTFLFFLLALFAIYLIIDLSIHGVRFFAKGNASLIETLLFYLNNFSFYLPLFIPFTFLLAMLRVLLSLNAHYELVAYQMGGLSQRALLSPFCLLAALLTLLSYANAEWVVPHAGKTIEIFETKWVRKKIKKEPLYTIALADHTEIIYRAYHPEKGQFSDLFWILSPQSFWHMKTLEGSTGHWVERFEKKNGVLKKVESFSERSFPELRAISFERLLPYEQRALTTLMRQAKILSTDRQSLLSHLYYKLATPLIPLLLVLSIGPFTFRFRRSQPTFLLLSLSLFSLLLAFIFLDGMLILGENRILPAAWAIGLPFGTLLAFALRNASRQTSC